MKINKNTRFHKCKGISDNFIIYSQTASWFAKDFHSEKQLLLDSNFSAQHPQPAQTKGPPNMGHAAGPTARRGEAAAAAACRRANHCLPMPALPLLWPHTYRPRPRPPGPPAHPSMRPPDDPNTRPPLQPIRAPRAPPKSKPTTAQALSAQKITHRARGSRFNQ